MEEEGNKFANTTNMVVVVVVTSKLLQKGCSQIALWVWRWAAVTPEVWSR